MGCFKREWSRCHFNLTILVLVTVWIAAWWFIHVVIFTNIVVMYSTLSKNLPYFIMSCNCQGGAIMIEFDVTKMKKRGEKNPLKHCYYNRLDYTICIFTAMGVYFSLLNSTWSDNNQYILFIKPRARDGYDSSRYIDCIKNWVTNFCDHVENFIQPNHVNIY